MNKLLVAVTVVFCAAGAGTVYSQVKTGRSFYTGQRALTLTPLEQYAYIAGVVDGMVATADVFSDGGPFFVRFESCRSGMTTGQLAVIYRRYLETHPEHWHHQGASVLAMAIEETCDK